MGQSKSKPWRRLSESDCQHLLSSTSSSDYLDGSGSNLAQTYQQQQPLLTWKQKSSTLYNNNNNNNSSKVNCNPSCEPGSVETAALKKRLTRASYFSGDPGQQRNQSYNLQNQNVLLDLPISLNFSAQQVPPPPPLVARCRPMSMFPKFTDHPPSLSLGVSKIPSLTDLLERINIDDLAGPDQDGDSLHSNDNETQIDDDVEDFTDQTMTPDIEFTKPRNGIASQLLTPPLSQTTANKPLLAIPSTPPPSFERACPNIDSPLDHLSTTTRVRRKSTLGGGSSLLIRCSGLDCLCDRCMQHRFKLLNWLLPNCTRINAERLLSGRAEGTFLVRKSEKFPGQYTLSFVCHRAVRHCLIMRSVYGFGLRWPYSFETLQQVIVHYARKSLAEFNSKLDVRLKYPVFMA